GRRAGRPGLRQPVDEVPVQAGRPFGRGVGRRDRSGRAGGGQGQGAVAPGRRRGDGRPRRRRGAREAAAVAMTMRTDYCGSLRAGDAGRQVTRCGWVASRREHGEHLAFIDLRDHTGIVQCVVDHAHDLRSEYVLRITGTVRARPEGTRNPNLPTGEVEVYDCHVEVLNTAEPPPFPVTDRVEADETIRLKHRYVDLRRDRM